MYLQTGGGGKGIRPNQQQQPQQQPHLQSQQQLQQQQTSHLNIGHHPHPHHHLQTQQQHLHTIHHNQTITSTTHFHQTVVQQLHNRQNTPPPTPPLLLGSAAGVHHLTQQPPPPTQSVRNTQHPNQTAGNHHNNHQQFHQHQQTQHFQAPQHLNVPPPAVPTHIYYATSLQLSQVGPPPTPSTSTNNGVPTSNSQQYKTSHRTNRGGENNNSGGNMLHSNNHHGRHQQQHHHTQQQHQQQQQQQQEQQDQQINQHGGQSYTNPAALMQTPTGSGGNVPSAFMTTPFMQTTFNQQSVMAAMAAQFNNGVATATGPPNTSHFVQSVRATAPPPQQQVQQIQSFVPNSATSYYTTGTPTTHNINTGMTGQHQICNLIPPPPHGGHGQQHQLPAPTAYMMPATIFTPIPQSSRGSLLTSSQPNNATVNTTNGGTSTSLIQSGISRGISTTHASYITPTYCQSPLTMAPNAPLLGSIPPFAAMVPSPSSSLTSMGSSTYLPTEKKRPHAIPIIDPETNQNILDPKPMPLQEKHLPKEEKEEEIAPDDKANNEQIVEEIQGTEFIDKNKEEVLSDVEETSDEHNDEEGLISSNEHEKDNTNEVKISIIDNDPTIFVTGDMIDNANDQFNSSLIDINNKMDQQMQTDAVKKQNVIHTKTWQCTSRQSITSNIGLYDEEYIPGTYYATPKTENTSNAMPFSHVDITGDQDIFDNTKNYGML